jgi:hypothetical protein
VPTGLGERVLTLGPPAVGVGASSPPAV